jgi:hypothetical protein
MSPLPEDAKPVRFIEEADAVQLNVVPETVEDKWMLVICPEHMEGVVELIITSGKGLTITVSMCNKPVQPFRSGVI